MKLLLIQGDYVAVYQRQKQVALYRVDWATETEPLELVKELLA
jgi:hypothetical protein